MTRLIAPISIAISSGVASLGGDLLEKHDVSVGTAVTVAIFTGSAVLWISRQFSKRDSAEAERTRSLEVRLAKIEQKIDDLPCYGQKCPDDSKHHH